MQPLPLLFNGEQVLMAWMMRFLFLLLLLFAAPTRAQVFNPAADYITAGQDEPGYRAWVTSAPNRSLYVRAFNDYLTANGVGGVAPTWQLLRTATDWQRCNNQPFEVPPTAAWPNIVAALRFIGAYIEPAIGPVEPVSVYRNPFLNVCAGGARTSTHLTAGAVDMVPLRQITREGLMLALCRIQVDKGSWNSIGLGFYRGLRFHVDSKKAREWVASGANGNYGCPAVLAGYGLPARAPSAIARPPITPQSGTAVDPLAPR